MRPRWWVTAATRILHKSALVIAAVLACSCSAPRTPLETIESEMAHAQRGSGAYWQLALKKAELLRTSSRRNDALSWLSQRTPDASAPRDLAVLWKRELAAVETDLARYRDADAHLVEAIQLAESSGQARMAANLKVRRSRVLVKLQDPRTADRCLNEAEAYSKSHNDSSLEPYILHYRGLVLSASNRFEEALAPLGRSLDEFTKRSLPSHAANVMITLAWCRHQLGQFDAALDLYNKALPAATPADKHLAVGHLGNMLLERRDFAGAAQHYQKAAALSREPDRDYHSVWLTNLAIANLEQGRWNDAERFNREAFDNAQQLDGSIALPYSILNAARIQASKNNFKSAELILRGILNGQGKDLTLMLDARVALADVYAKSGRSTAAEEQFGRALDVVDTGQATLQENENKLTYLASLIRLHQRYVDFLMDRGKKDAALAIAESSRSRLLRERLNLPRAQRRGRDVNDYLQASEASGATFLLFWVAPVRSYLWVITPQESKVFPLPGEPAIRTLVERHQRETESVDAAAGTAGAELWKMLLGGANGLLRAGGAYVIVPDGPLHGINFETLPAGGRGGRFWIEDATVAIAPSLDVLLDREERSTRPGKAQSLLAIGDANEWSDDYPKLIYARDEIERIRRPFTKDRVRVLATSDATPKAYAHAQPGAFSYIHFAAHATANRNSPLDSAIILSGGAGQGRLSVRDVMATPVQADLVTIAACHSAGARTYAGEGLVGLVWAFLQSGAKSVVAALWKVSEYSSPLLMEKLYGGLADGRPPIEALRLAKLELIRGGKYRHPHYWAPFQLYLGAPQPRATPAHTQSSQLLRAAGR